MAWQIVSVGSGIEVTSGSITLPTPAGTFQAGDLFVAFLSWRGNVAPSADAAWTFIATQNSGNTDAGATTGIASGSMLYHVRGASNPSFTFGWAGSGLLHGRVIVYRSTHGAVDANPLVGSNAQTMAVAGTAISNLGIDPPDSTFDTLMVHMVSGARAMGVSAFDSNVTVGVSGAADTTTAPGTAWIERADVGTTTGPDASLAIADALHSGYQAITFSATAGLSARHVTIAAGFKEPAATGLANTVLDKAFSRHPFDWRISDNQLTVNRWISGSGEANPNHIRSNRRLSTAKRIVAFTPVGTVDSVNNWTIGFVEPDLFTGTSQMGVDNVSIGMREDGTVWFNNTQIGTTSAWSSGQKIYLALDFNEVGSNFRVHVNKGGVWYPAEPNGSNGWLVAVATFAPDYELVPAVQNTGTTTEWTLTIDGDASGLTLPAGYLPWNNTGSVSDSANVTGLAATGGVGGVFIAGTPTTVPVTAPAMTGSVGGVTVAGGAITVSVTGLQGDGNPGGVNVTASVPTGGSVTRVFVTNTNLTARASVGFARPRHGASTRFLPSQWASLTGGFGRFGCLVDKYVWHATAGDNRTVTNASQTARPYAIVSPDNDTIQFEVRNGDVLEYAAVGYSDPSTSERAELGGDSGGDQQWVAANTVVIEYDFWVNSGFNFNTNWCVCGQMHANTPTTPPFEFTFRQGTALNRLLAIRKTGNSGSPVEQTFFVSPAAITRDTWHSIKLIYKFGTSPNGILRVWYDGVLVVDFTGTVGYSDQTYGYWRYGIYRRVTSDAATYICKYKSFRLNVAPVSTQQRPSTPGAYGFVGQLQFNQAATSGSINVFAGPNEATGQVGTVGFGNIANVSVTGLAATGGVGTEAFAAIGAIVNVTPVGAAATGTIDLADITVIQGEGNIGGLPDPVPEMVSAVGGVGVDTTGSVGVPAGSSEGFGQTGQVDIVTTAIAVAQVTADYNTTGLVGTAVAGPVTVVTVAGADGIGRVGSATAAFGGRFDVTGTQGTTGLGTAIVVGGQTANATGVAGTGQVGTVVAGGVGFAQVSGLQAAGQVGAVTVIAVSANVSVQVFGTTIFGQVGTAFVPGGSHDRGHGGGSGSGPGPKPRKPKKRPPDEAFKRFTTEQERREREREQKRQASERLLDNDVRGVPRPKPEGDTGEAPEEAPIDVLAILRALQESGDMPDVQSSEWGDMNDNFMPAPFDFQPDDEELLRLLMMRRIAMARGR